MRCRTVSWSRRLGYPHTALPVEPDREAGEDRQVGVHADPFDSADPQRQHGPFVLEMPELALDGSPLAVQILEPFRTARDERVYAVGLHPYGRWRALFGRATPFRRDCGAPGMTCDCLRWDCGARGRECDCHARRMAVEAELRKDPALPEWRVRRLADCIVEDLNVIRLERQAASSAAEPERGEE